MPSREPNIELIHQNDLCVIKVIRHAQDSVSTIADTLPKLQTALQSAESERLLIDGTRMNLSCATLLDMDTLAMRFIAAVPACRYLAVVCDSVPKQGATHYANLCLWKQIRVKYFDQVEDALGWLTSGRL